MSEATVDWRALALQAQRERDEARAEVERLRAALEKIAKRGNKSAPNGTKIICEKCADNVDWIVRAARQQGWNLAAIIANNALEDHDA